MHLYKVLMIRLSNKRMLKILLLIDFKNISELIILIKYQKIFYLLIFLLLSFFFKSDMDSIWISSVPYLHILLVEIIPDFFIFRLIKVNCIFHNNYFIIFCYVSLRNLPMIEMHLTIHFQVLISKTHQIFIILMSFQWNWGVVIEK